jgi:hypothetical protein
MRRTERFAVELPVIWNRAGRAIDCTAIDVNAHGIFVRTDEVVEHDSLMHLRLQLPERALEMFVTARYVGNNGRGHGVGCEIFLIDDVSRAHWLAYYETVRVANAARKQSAAGGR